MDFEPSPEQRAIAETIDDNTIDVDQLSKFINAGYQEAGLTKAEIRELSAHLGLPTADNTHEVAQRLAPESRIVYVDHDPLVLAHARAIYLGEAPDFLAP